MDNGQTVINNLQCLKGGQSRTGMETPMVIPSGEPGEFTDSLLKGHPLVHRGYTAVTRVLRCERLGFHQMVIFTLWSTLNHGADCVLPDPGMTLFAEQK